MTKHAFRWTLAALLSVAMMGLFTASASAQAKKKVLFLTKSSGFQHDQIQRKNGAPLGPAEKIFTDFADKAGYEVTCTKDASMMGMPENIAKYDVFAFYITGDLTKDSNHEGIDEKAMTPEQKDAMLAAIRAGKGVIGFHSATDAFHSKGEVDPYTKMIGGEFLTHGAQQKATIHVKFKFPGLEDLKDYDMLDEWYVNKNLNPDICVILSIDTKDMKGPQYQRAPYPMTWARMEGKGRVFYTAMGHRNDVWTNPIMQKVTIAGLDWVSGKTDVKLEQNIETACPGAIQK
jgi:type 1 glutamine amidotransferase